MARITPRGRFGAEALEELVVGGNMDVGSRPPHVVGFLREGGGCGLAILTRLETIYSVNYCFILFIGRGRGYVWRGYSVSKDFVFFRVVIDLLWPPLLCR